jgi:tRNA 2-thiouridine synthesizing protein A
MNSTLTADKRGSRPVAENLRRASPVATPDCGSETVERFRARDIGVAWQRIFARHRGPIAIDTQGDTGMNFDKELDARGLSCPLPILKTKKSLNELASGQVLKVVATDPGSIKDMQAFSNQTGNALLSSAEENKTYIFYLKKK